MTTTDFILDYWESQAFLFGGSHEASWGDLFGIGLELNAIDAAISERAPDAKDILDVGCANGFSTIRQAYRHPHADFHGIDFSETMIDKAHKALETAGAHERGDITFAVGDVRALEIPDGAYDVVYTTRVLINLPSWTEKAQGVHECLRVLKPGGTLILVEGFFEPAARLNAVRIAAGLEPLGSPDHNRLLWKHQVEGLLEELGHDFVCDRFSGVYYLGSRFLRELVGETGYRGLVNETFLTLSTELPAGDVDRAGDFSIGQAYIVTKP